MSRKMTENMFSLVFWEDLKTHSVIKTNSIKHAKKGGKLTVRKNNKNDKEYLEMVDVDETGKIILNKIKQRVDKERKKMKRIKTGRNVNPKANDEEIISAKSIFDVDAEKPSTPSGKRRTIGLIITSSDEDNETDKVRVVPRKEYKNQTQNDYDEFSAMANVSENEEIIANVKPSYVEETGRIQIGRNVDQPMNLDQNRVSRSYFGANFRKMSSLTGKRRASSPIISSSDDNSDSDEARASPKKNNNYWMRDNDKTSKKLNVNENKKMAFSKMTSNLETDKEKFQIRRKVHPLMNDEKTALPKSYLTANCSKLPSLTVKQKASDPIFTSSDEDKDLDETEVIPRKNVEKSLEIFDVHFQSPSLKKKYITAQKDRQHNSSVNNEKILFSRPKFNTDLQIPLPSTSKNPKTNKTDDLKKLPSLSTKTNTNRSLSFATDEDSDYEDIQIKNSKVFVKENRNTESILQKNKLQTRLVHYSISSEDSSDNDNDTRVNNLSKIDDDTREVRIMNETNKTNNESTKKSNNDDNLKEYVNANVSRGHEVSVGEFQSIVGTLCCTIRGKFKAKEIEKKKK
ncbi:uncharacterized protein DDB_G0288805-like [Cotesia glomerata]|uniref:uncharacterized protein DDB_G0288805-like n=1 Tax=Cotesia glomerata TaxID=32391 RepID=UPI001D00CC69|nr:uncharacterized protein DDB_G0288805-like [Cotesia glomerata]